VFPWSGRQKVLRKLFVWCVVSRTCRKIRCKKLGQVSCSNFLTVCHHHYSSVWHVFLHILVSTDVWCAGNEDPVHCRDRVLPWHWAERDAVSQAPSPAPTRHSLYSLWAGWNDADAAERRQTSLCRHPASCLHCHSSQLETMPRTVQRRRRRFRIDS